MPNTPNPNESLPEASAKFSIRVSLAPDRFERFQSASKLTGSSIDTLLAEYANAYMVAQDEFIATINGTKDNPVSHMAGLEERLSHGMEDIRQDLLVMYLNQQVMLSLLNAHIGTTLAISSPDNMQDRYDKLMRAAAKGLDSSGNATVAEQVVELSQSIGKA